MRLKRLVTILLFVIGSLPYPAVLGSANEVGDAPPPRLLEWPMLPGESLRQLAQHIYPRDPAMQRHFIDAAIRQNPTVFSGFGAEDPFERETLIWLPDLKQLANLATASARPRHYLRPQLPAMQPSVQGAHPAPLQISAQLTLAPNGATQPLPSAGENVRLIPAGQIRSTRTAVAFDSWIRSVIDALMAHNAVLKAEQERLEARIAALEKSVAEMRATLLRMQDRSATPARLPPPKPGSRPASPSLTAGSLLSPTPLHWLSMLAVIVAGSAVVWMRRRHARPSHKAAAAPATLPPFPMTQMEVEVITEPANAESTPNAPAPNQSRPPPDTMMVDEIDSVVEEARVLVALGRTERAIAMLEEYINAHPRTSANPWLYLLDLYRNLNRRDEFTALAKRFHQSFNVIAPQWEPPAQTMMVVPRSLTEFPHIMARLTESWGTLDAQDYLNHLLQDNRGGERQGFSMEVLQEILLLLAVLELRDTLPELKPF